MYVLTVFFCGTGSTSFDVHNPNYPMGEVVSTLASHHSGMEFVDWIICDGPGSGNLQEDEKWVTPGNYGDKHGKLLGAGWEENVAHAVAVIKGTFTWSRTKLTDEQHATLKRSGVAVADKKLVAKGWFSDTYENPDRKVTQQELQAQKAKIFRKGRKVDAVNVIGWSRGGVSCIMLANKMYEDMGLRAVPVRIFAVDPVPGLANFQRNRTTLPPNVQDFVGVYARDEVSKGFAPIVPALPTGMSRKPTVMPFPGRHATLAGNGSVDGGSGEQREDLLTAGKLVRHLAEACLTSWGTPLDKRLDLSKQQIEALCTTMIACNGDFAKMQAHSYTYFTDKTGGERTVGFGAEGKGRKFSAVTGFNLSNPAGLSCGIDSAPWLAAYLRDCVR